MDSLPTSFGKAAPPSSKPNKPISKPPRPSAPEVTPTPKMTSQEATSQAYSNRNDFAAAAARGGGGGGGERGNGRGRGRGRGRGGDSGRGTAFHGGARGGARGRGAFGHADHSNKRQRFDQSASASSAAMTSGGGEPIAYFNEAMFEDPWRHLS